MTKVQLLKWLDGKQREALAEVKEQHRAAQERLLEMKIEKSGYPELAASVLPLLQEVFDKLEAIHKDHEDLIFRATARSRAIGYIFSASAGRCW